MTKYLLDTNVVSEVRKPKPHGAVLAWLAGLRNQQAYLSAVTLGELQAGVELTRSQNPSKAREIEKWIDLLEDAYLVLPMDGACFREWGRMMHRKPNQLIEDVMIAATARVHDLVVATRNEVDFAQFDVPVINPFKTSL